MMAPSMASNRQRLLDCIRLVRFLVVIKPEAEIGSVGRDSMAATDPTTFREPMT